MVKRVFLFPGQGSQYVGMGKEFYDAVPESKAVYELASRVTGLDIAELCFTENDRLNITEYTQIAMLTTEAALYAALTAAGVGCDAAAGLSLGEYGALIVSGALSMEDAFALVRKRGMYMQQAYPQGGGMSAVLGLDADAIADVCEKTAAELGAVVSVANYNCPGQTVITGELSAMTAAGERCAEAGAKRVVPLRVSGPFHSALLTGAGDLLEKELESVTFSDIRIPYLTNVTADYVTDKEQIPALLVKQVSSPVRWQQTIERLIADGAEEFVEIGPGRSLSGFMRRIDRSATVCNIDKMEDFRNYVKR